MNPAPRESVRERAGYRREYCLLAERCSSLPFEMDHVIPEKHGGLTESANLALACCYCNRFKGPNLSGLDPQTRDIARLFHPRRDSWNDHFRWDGVTLVGMTAVGRATVQVLSVNLPGHLRVRSALRDEGLFPPK